MAQIVKTAPNFKCCSKCHREFPNTEQYFRKQSKVRLRPDCKECDRAYQKAYFARPEVKERTRVNSRNRRVRLKDTPRYREYRTEQNRRRRERRGYTNEWYNLRRLAQAKGKKLCSRCRQELPPSLEYFGANGKNADGLNSRCRECERELMRAYKKRRPDMNHMQNLRYLSKKRGLPATFADSDWQDALTYWHGCCAVCGRPAGLWHTLAQDHWIPVSKGGGYVPGNIVPLCHGIGGCNNEKSDKDPVEWLISKYSARKAKTKLNEIETFLAIAQERSSDA